MMKINSYQKAVKYLEGFVGKVQFKLDPEFVKHHDPLERMRVLLDLLGNPQNQFKSILIGGTSGKGSVAVFTANILTKSGCKTGLMVKPHLQKINERIQLNGQQVNDKQFRSLVYDTIPAIEKMEKMEIGSPSYFEILTAMAFKFFAKEKVDIAVVEVGMGGEFDATNTLYPLVSVITNVSLDHTDALGNTVEKIAKTKAGIVKKSSNESLGVLPLVHPASARLISPSEPNALRAVGSPSLVSPLAKANGENFVGSPRQELPIVISGVRQKSVIRIVEKKCREVGSEFSLLNRNFSYKIKNENISGSVFDFVSVYQYSTTIKNLVISMLGKYQVENASIAIEVILELRKLGFKIDERNIRNGLKNAFFPGRFEVINILAGAEVGNENFLVHNAKKYSKLNPVQVLANAHSENFVPSPRQEIKLILDGAHNPEKMRAFLSALEKLYPKTSKIFIVSFKKGKEIKPMLRQILDVADTVIITRFYSTTDFAKSMYAAEKISNLKSQISKIGNKRRIKIFYEENSKKALEKAFEMLKQVQHDRRIGTIVVTGSLYLVGEVRSYLVKKA